VVVKGNTTVIGYDLRNEPINFGATGSSWGDGSDRDIKEMYTHVGDAILAIDPDKLIFAEGVITYMRHGYVHSVGSRTADCFGRFKKTCLLGARIPARDFIGNARLGR
jgi:aryl-phospho-beta-D-glucosidase BglC (GH1 family)